jgi:SAM-dependent methyltransferase
LGGGGRNNSSGLYRRLRKFTTRFFEKILCVKRKGEGKVLRVLGFEFLLTKNKKLNYCPFCDKYLVFTDFGANKRKNVRCPQCLSLERHRFLYRVYLKYFLNSQHKIKILHTAPEKCICNAILKNKSIEYIPIDLDPPRYKFVKCKKEDVTNLSFADNTFDIILSNHIMEHLEDDNKFLQECLRVLKPQGKLFLTFPIFPIQKTFEDKNIKTREEREKAYGQGDHLRLYGADVVERLKRDYGAKVILGKDIVSNRDIKMMKFNPKAGVFIIEK